MKKIHYKNLNSLRFVAAFLVIIHHIEQVKSIKGYSNIWSNKAIELIGPLGVDLFFVLSGFLITSLLYEERKQFGVISIPKFLMRRVLRIWPLYFLVFFFGFFVAPIFPQLSLGLPFISVKNNLYENIFLYILFLPHVQSFFIGPILYCSQTWSVGIEENFYLIWPFLLMKIRPENKLIKSIIIFIVSYLIIVIIGKYFSHIGFHSILAGLTFLVYGLKFDCLLIGALFSIYNERVFDNFPFVFHPIFQVAIYFTEIILVGCGLNFTGFFWEVHAVIYGLIIINVTRQTSIFSLEFWPLDYLGKISYGLYMYQFIVIDVVVTFCHLHEIEYAILPLTSIGIFALAAASYHTFEAYFMKHKIQFSKIETG